MRHAIIPAMAKRTEATGIRKHGRSFRFEIKKNGKRHYINLETDDFSEAVKRANAIRANPTVLAPSGLLGEIDRFIAYQLRMQIYTRHTAVTKKNKLKLLSEFLPAHATAASVTTKQLQGWHDALLKTVTTSTIDGYMMSARAFFRWASEVERLRHTQPMDGVKLVKSEGRARKDFCSFEVRDRLIANCTDMDLKFVLLCGFHAGLRLNEIIQARPFWFDLPGMRIVLRQTPTMKFKDREERTIPLTIEFAEFLKNYGLREPFMLKPEIEQGIWLYRYDPRRVFRSYIKAQGVKITPHTMRHTFASLLVTAGESIYKVAVWMGDNVDTVQKHYGHLGPDMGGIEKAFSRSHLHTPPGKSPDASRSQA